MLSQNNTNYVVAVATYKNVLPNGGDDINTTSASLRQVLLDSSATNEDVAALGKKYGIFVVAQAVQAQGFGDASTALDAGFGTVDISKHPFANMKEEDNPNAPTMPDIPETPTSDFTWTDTGAGNEFIITGYTGTATQVKVPQTIEGKPVTMIDKNAFANKSDLTHVVLPEGVTSIGTRAFEGCTNQCINIPSTVQTIGAYAFTECDCLTNIAFPAGITIIPEGVCAGCDELTTVTMSEDVTNIGKKAFYRCNILESMTSD
ncbi:MAG: leucine-rich repeat domain-containing protein [Clostridiales bacterium]|nr:leucine-rich repeat domain-containing protein [Clostridiales bacterium]